jgi:hypothetical protein
VPEPQGRAGCSFFRAQKEQTMTTLDPAQALMAEMMAVRLVVTATVAELLGSSPDRKEAAEKLLNDALNRAEIEPISLDTPDAIDAMRDAVGERISALITGALLGAPRDLGGRGP